MAPVGTPLSAATLWKVFLADDYSDSPSLKNASRPAPDPGTRPPSVWTTTATAAAAPPDEYRIFH
jgi:hypothetical protein